PRLDAVELLQGAVLVVAALDQQQRLLYSRKEVLDRPAPKFGMQPAVGPAEKRIVDARVVLGQPLPDVGLQIALAGPGDALHANRLDEHMGRQADEAADGPA